jgi:cell wall-associated NlpC family hydrolase
MPPMFPYCPKCATAFMPPSWECRRCGHSIAKERLAVVAQAHKWLGTPYHHAAAVMGVGVDCAQIMCQVYPAALPWMTGKTIETPYYPQDWHLHRGDEVYLRMIEQYAEPVETPAMGDIAVFHFGRTYSHGAIVIEWPNRIIHALMQSRCVTLDNPVTNMELSPRKRLFYSPWKKHYGIS